MRRMVPASLTLLLFSVLAACSTARLESPVPAPVRAALTQPASKFPLVEARESHPRKGLPNVFAKLAAGQEVRIAYLGGSITAQPGWRVQSFQWFQKEFPHAKLVEINAAIGGTGSDLGVFRLQQDVLRHAPDLLFVEFAVNDAGGQPGDIARAIEGIVRQTWRQDPNTDICFVYTITRDIIKPLHEGKYPVAASVMEAVAEHYGIPSIHLALEVARLEQEGKLVMAAPLPKTDAEKAAAGARIAFAGDGVHPYPETGHRLYMDAIRRALPGIRASGRRGPHARGAPLLADHWEQAKLVPLSALRPAGGWVRLDPARNPMAKNWTSRLPELWHTNTPGSTLSFRVKGRAVAIYDLLGPDCGQVTVKLDNQPERIVPRFDRYCTYHRLATLPIGRSLPEGVHAVTLTLHAEPPNKVKIFQDGKQFDENPAGNPKYQGINWYAGAVMVIGEVE